MSTCPDAGCPQSIDTADTALPQEDNVKVDEKNGEVVGTERLASGRNPFDVCWWFPICDDLGPDHYPPTN